jgi:hypothetical protein
MTQITHPTDKIISIDEVVWHLTPNGYYGEDDSTGRYVGFAIFDDAGFIVTDHPNRQPVLHSKLVPTLKEVTNTLREWRFARY